MEVAGWVRGGCSLGAWGPSLYYYCTVASAWARRVRRATSCHEYIAEISLWKVAASLEARLACLGWKGVGYGMGYAMSYGRE